MRKLSERPHALIFPKGEGKTEQAHKDDCDINKIMKRALRGHSSDYVRDDLGSYGDATSLDFYQANVLVAEAKSMFEGIPSTIRNRFDNDPGKFLEFIQNPSNKDEAIELGLVKKPPPEVFTEESTAPAVKTAAPAAQTTAQSAEIPPVEPAQ